ncbi:endoglucanase 4-like isoform X3 [Haliotis rubra]|uniref:endoglucanase 4-like n=1 Tax=Haliotis rubra TaxID=36100 RepID=UPI001EE59FED|nr:endoglucanase 4-like [Haliotis rubra]XP_046580060.1 endoglucanase 4-like isoform X3 [Haliotis rubra]
MRLLLLLVLLANGHAESEVKITGHWEGGFNGQFCIPVTEDLHGWSAHVIFDQSIKSLDVQQAAEIVETRNNNTEFIMHNKDWNKEEHVGSQICINLLGKTDGNIIPSATVYIAGMDGPTDQPPTAGPQNSLLPGSSGQTPGIGATSGVGATSAPFVTSGTGIGGGEEVITNKMQIYNDWGNRFEAEFSFPVHQRIEGWEVAINFSEPVDKLDMWVADVYKKSADGKTWVVINKQDHVFFDKGDTIKLRFFGNTQASSAPSAVATLTNLGHDDNGFPNVKNTGGTKYNYDEVLYKSILFYDAQRSGKLPANNPIPWRGDSALGDKGDNGEDLTGGWYDAGDHVKFNFPMSWSTTILTWSLLQWKEAYVESGQYDNMLDSIRWPLDYLLKCHTAKDELYVQVGNGGADHSFWGRPEDMKMARPAFKITPSKPGSDVAGQTAAAFAAGSMAFKDKDAAYSKTLLDHAVQLYDFAMANKGRYSQSVPAAAQFYPSTNNTDEHAWAGLWLYQATGDPKYLTEAEKYHQPGEAWGMSWDDNQAANNILFYKLTRKDIYKQDLEDTFEKYWFPNQVIKYTPKGLAWRLQWGSLRYASNMALAALMAAEAGVNPDKYREWAMSQIHYALGDTGFSYLIGFGKNYPHSPHHRSSSCPWPPAPCGPQVMSSHAPNVHTLYGAMVGGPDSSDGYKDDRSNYVNNEVACDYNAGFQAAVAGLRSLANRNIHPEQLGP